MATMRPFKGIRPKAELAAQVACLPYDVMNREEAKMMAEGNALSFLHVVRPEIDVDDTISQYDDQVYIKGRDNLRGMLMDEILLQENAEVFYIYRQIMNGRVQTGIVGCVSVDEYMNNTIKKHEFTRPEKEEDRVKNFDTCNANTAPVFLTYRERKEITQTINDWIKFHVPIYDFAAEDGIQHIIWVVDDQDIVKHLNGAFEAVDNLYIADGHHRSASAARVALKRRQEKPDYTGDEEFNYFLAVTFPDEDLFIMDYNRVVKDLNGYSTDEFFNAVQEHFEVEKTVQQPYKPMEKAAFGMYIDGKWYKLKAKEGTYPAEDPVESLDVSILQKLLLGPILGIEDARRDKRIDFIGGIRGLEELERRCSKDMRIAFAMYPTTMDELLSIADAGEVMPPKSTWFEPKLRSGLFVHPLNGIL